jgi:hypothetical protein
MPIPKGSVRRVDATADATADAGRKSSHGDQ